MVALLTAYQCRAATLAATSGDAYFNDGVAAVADDGLQINACQRGKAGLMHRESAMLLRHEEEIHLHNHIIDKISGHGQPPMPPFGSRECRQTYISDNDTHG
jgi:hypothetical protein